VLFPVFKSGKISTLACPATSEFGILLCPTSISTAASYCIGPSIFKSGRFFSQFQWQLEPYPLHPLFLTLQKNSIAIFGSIPKARLESAEEMVPPVVLQ
jgi:hypothetical protein